MGRLFCSLAEKVQVRETDRDIRHAFLQVGTMLGRYSNSVKVLSETSNSGGPIGLKLCEESLESESGDSSGFPCTREAVRHAPCAREQYKCDGK